MDGSIESQSHDIIMESFSSHVINSGVNKMSKFSLSLKVHPHNLRPFEKVFSIESVRKSDVF